MTAFPIRRRLIVVLPAVAMAIGSAHADVTYTQKTKIRGAGDMVRADVVRIVRIRGDKAREEATVQLSGTTARNAGTEPLKLIEIRRLDQSLIWTLDPKDKTFAEKSLDEVRADLVRLAAEADTSTNCMESPDAAPVISVKPSEQMRKIGPWEATRTTITAATRVIDLTTGQTRNGEVALDLWMAPDVPGQDEMRAFDSAWSSRLALASERFPLEGLAGGYQRSMEKIRAAFDKLAGVPVEWTWVVRTELSPQDRAALAEAAKLQEEGVDPSPRQEQEQTSAPLADPLAQVQTRSPEAGSDKDRPRPLEPQSGENLSPTSADQEIDTERGMTVIFRAESSLKSAENTPIDPAAFEIPAEYSRETRVTR